ncbi:primase-like DNA-binding domain-containing protein [Heyndrickxia sporothermodurans]|uniref:primase-like DNA-binding domain-containing protein n=1 Tax=Heyndrickxia sporothermodurans TaxID=46224 RepID=UPI00399D0677
MKKFIQENLERDIKSFEKNDDLYKRYLKYCKFYNLEPITKRSFTYQLKKHNIGIYHKRMKNYVIEYGRWGVKLLPCKY